MVNCKSWRVIAIEYTHFGSISGFFGDYHEFKKLTDNTGEFKWTG
jgi:hypothetical protein